MLTCERYNCQVEARNQAEKTARLPVWKGVKNTNF